MVLRVAICPKWPSPIYPCPTNHLCDVLSYLWPLLAVVKTLTFTGLRFHFEIYMDRSNRSIKLLLLCGILKLDPKIEWINSTGKIELLE